LVITPDGKLMRYQPSVGGAIAPNPPSTYVISP
jgi:hypothetical protein